MEGMAAGGFNPRPFRMNKVFTEKDDHDKFYLHVPDPDFSPKRNAFVIAESIRKHNAMIQKKQKEHVDDYAERADALVSYLRAAEANPGKGLKQYFGRSMLAYLRGEHIRQKLMANMRIIGRDGQEIRNPWK